MMIGLPRLAGPLVLLAMLSLAPLGMTSCRREPPATPAGSQPGNDEAHQAQTLYARRLGDRTTRAEVARNLGREKAAGAIEPLRAAAKDPDPAIREACLWALGEIGDASAAEALSFYVSDPEPAVKRAAVEALGKLRSPEAVPALSEGRADEDVEIRRLALAGLVAIPGEQATRELVKVLEDPDHSLRLVAASALVDREGDVAVEGILQALADANAEVRAVAAEAVRKRKKEILPGLREALSKTRDVDARLDAARLLAPMKDLETVPVLLGLLENLPRHSRRDPGELQTIVVDALVAMGEPVLGALKAEAMDGECGSLAERAVADVCLRIGEPAVQPIVETILAWKLFPDPEELALWVRTLGHLGDAGALPAFRRALAQDVEGMADLVAEARRAIEARSGKSMPPSSPERGLFAGDPGDMAHQSIPRGSITFTPADRGAGALPSDGVVRFSLPGALFKLQGDSDLEIELLRRDGKWDPALWGYALRFNKRSHPGRLIEQSVGDSQNLRVELAILKDQWVAGGFAEYEITLDGMESPLEGTYRGHFNGRHVSGPVTGICWKRDWSESSGSSLSSGEHPRLIFRSEHLPILRQRVKTGLGRRILRALRSRIAAHKELYREPVNWVTTWEPGMDCAIGHAFLAQLFDDPRHGRRAAALMTERTRVPPYGGEHGERFPRPVSLFPYAYDLGYEYLEPAEREAIAEKLRTFYSLYSVEWGPHGIFAVNRSVFAVPGLMGLAVLGDQGPFHMTAPEAPPPVIALPPDAKLKSSEGVPVRKLEPGALLKDCLMTGPFDVRGGEDPLVALGERSALRPDRDTAVFYRGVRYRFVPLPSDSVGAVTGPNLKCEYFVVPGAAPESLSFLYALLEVDQEAGCLVDRRYPLGTRWAAIWIDGRPIEDGTTVMFQPGLHRVLIEVRGSVTSPVLPPADVGAARARLRKYEWLLGEWQAAKRLHEETGELQEVRLIYDMCRRGLRTHAFGEIVRAQSTGKTSGGAGVPFVSACWTATGQALFPDTPLLIAEHPEELSSDRLDPRTLCFAMGVAPDSLKPAVAAEFQKRYYPDRLSQLSCLELIAAFVNYPLDITLPESSSE